MHLLMGDAKRLLIQRNSRQGVRPGWLIPKELAERGGLYCSFFRNSLVFSHFIRKTRIFCRLRPSLSSLVRRSSALQSLLWTSKVLKKSNISNKLGFPSCAAIAGQVHRFPDAGPIPSVVQCSSPKICVPHRFFHRFHLYQILRRTRPVQDPEAQEVPRRIVLRAL
jgi:hypothetical protein